MNCPSRLNEVIDQVNKYVEIWEQLVQQLNKDIALVGLNDIELQTKINTGRAMDKPAAHLF